MKYIFLTTNYSSYRGGGSRMCSQLICSYLQQTIDAEDVYIIDLTSDSSDNIHSHDGNVYHIPIQLPRNYTLFPLIQPPEARFIQMLKYPLLDCINRVSNQFPHEEFCIIYDSDAAISCAPLIRNNLDITISKQLCIIHSTGHAHYLKASQYQLFGHIVRKITHQDIQSYINVINTMDACICFTHNDAEFLSYMVTTPIEVIHPLIYPQDELHAPHPFEKTVLITTNISFLDNKLSLDWFLDHVLPHIHSDIHIRITGKGDFTEYRKNSTQKERVLFLGYVHSLVLKKLFLHSTVVVNPTIRGERRIQLKTLEAMSYNCEIISTEFANHFPEFITTTHSALDLAHTINKVCLEGSRHIQETNYIDFFDDNLKHFQSLFVTHAHPENNI